MAVKFFHTQSRSDFMTVAVAFKPRNYGGETRRGATLERRPNQASLRDAPNSGNYAPMDKSLVITHIFFGDVESPAV
jgi:hypothetical protein